MIRPTRQTRTIALAVALWLPVPTFALAPALLAFVQQLAQQAATSMIKDALLSGLAGMGCKGIALSNALAGFDKRLAGGGAGLPAGAMPMMPGMTPGMPTDVPPEMMARMQAMLPGGGPMPPGMTGMLPGGMRPLTPPETLATIDALFELGFMPATAQSEFRQCMLLVPETIPALGTAMGMLRPMVPQLREARDELRALSPAEQDEVAAALAHEVGTLPADQREALMEHIDSGFFPARLSQGVKARLAPR